MPVLTVSTKPLRITVLIERGDQLLVALGGALLRALEKLDHPVDIGLRCEQQAVVGVDPDLPPGHPERDVDHERLAADEQAVDVLFAPGHQRGSAWLRCMMNAVIASRAFSEASARRRAMSSTRRMTSSHSDHNAASRVSPCVLVVWS